MAGHSFFVAFTPLHVLLSSVLAMKDRLERNVEKTSLWVVDLGLPQIDAMLDVFRSSSDSPFTDVAFTTHHHLVTGSVRKLRAYRDNLTAIRRYLTSSPPARVYVFNDARAESQVALEMGSRHGGAIGIYGEDGMAAYASTKLPPTSFMNVAGRWLVQRSGYEQVRILGTSRRITEVRCLFPEHLRPELADRTIRAVPRALFTSSSMRSLSSQLLDALGVSRNALASVEALVLVGYSPSVTDRTAYRSSITRLLDRFRREGTEVAVKYHPREPAQDYLALVPDGWMILPQACPSEAILLSSDSMRIIAGHFSTSLMTSRWLIPEAKVMMIDGPDEEPIDPRIDGVLRELRITRTGE